MTDKSKCYGLKDWDRLEPTPEDVLERAFEYEFCNGCEDFDTIADTINWPLKVYVFQRMDKPLPWRLDALLWLTMSHGRVRLLEK